MQDDVNHKGTATLETARLVLRRFEASDAQQMFVNWASDAANLEYLGWNAYGSVEDLKATLLKWEEEYSDSSTYRWCIAEKETREAVGEISVVYDRPPNRCAEIGYVLSKGHWGQGYAPEAFKAVIDFLFKDVGYHKVIARHDVDNPASGAVMEKCGLEYEATFIDGHLRKDGTWGNAIQRYIINPLD